MSETLATEVPGGANSRAGLRTYYASMTESELITVAKNRNSFIRLARDLLEEELERRRMTAPAVAAANTGQTLSRLAILWRLIRRGRAQWARATRETLAPPPLPERDYLPQPPPRMHRSSRGGFLGATEDQVSMVGTLPERLNGKGTKIEDIAGTGQHDSLGG